MDLRTGLVLLLFFICKSNSNVGDKARLYCKAYGEAVYTFEDSPVLSRKIKKNRVADCGIVSIPLIIGGKKAQEKEFPHMAVIGFGDSPMDELAWDCGGALISDLYVLTAAHCLHSREKGNSQAVKLGAIEMDSPDMIQRDIVRRVGHPQYKRPQKYHDIALIKMSSPIQFDPYIRPACLDTRSFIPERKAWATGWGKLEYAANSGSRHLMKVQLDIIPNQECSSFFNEERLTLNNGMTHDVMCAGVLEGGKDTCQGDSGGPLQVVLKEPYCMYSIIGVTSFGKFCGYAQSPGIYMKVSSYIRWIENIVWP